MERAAGYQSVDICDDGRLGDSLGAQTAAATGCWYESDLQLAAELGKNLLERNRDLEGQLRSAQHSHLEAVKEADLLSRQLDVLRSVGESRALLYEEVDKNLHSLERSNETLKHQAQKDKEKINRLTSTVEGLEAQVEGLQSCINDLHKQQHEQRKQKPRARSVPSLQELLEQDPASPNEYLGFRATSPRTPRRTEHSELRELKNSVRGLRLQLTVEKRKREDAESDLACLSEEREALKGKLEEVCGEAERERERDVRRALTSTFLCRECGGERSTLLPDRGLIEHDLKEIPPHGELVRLKNGGSAFGSRESLNMLGLQTDDDTPSKEVVQDILMKDIAVSREEKDEEGGTMSLLTELEEQYTKLVHRYEALIEAKSKKNHQDISTQDNLNSSPRNNRRPTKLPVKPMEEQDDDWRAANSTLDFKSPYNPVDDHFENGPPQYKKLFKEIFETLRQSIVHDVGAQKK